MLKQSFVAFRPCRQADGSALNPCLQNKYNGLLQQYNFWSLQVHIGQQQRLLLQSELAL